MRGAGRPFADLVEPTTFEVLQHMFDAQGRPTPYHVRSHLGGRPTGELIDAVVEAGGGLTSPERGPPPAEGRRRGQGRPGRRRLPAPGASYCLEIGAAWRMGDEDGRRGRAPARRLSRPDLDGDPVVGDRGGGQPSRRRGA
ncbi:hypothetical protein [Microbispora rosea]|uniref:hypothetical protein n=1 Tax=Microbispora rosea TaxID=58117 RepID=UPI00341F8E80